MIDDFKRLAARCHNKHNSKKIDCGELEEYTFRVFKYPSYPYQYEVKFYPQYKVYTLHRYKEGLLREEVR